jgi:hypothetical protein
MRRKSILALLMAVVMGVVLAGSASAAAPSGGVANINADPPLDAIGTPGDDVEIAVWANVDDDIRFNEHYYDIEVRWGNMAFQFYQKTNWNPLTLRYDIVSDAEWVTESEDDYLYLGENLDVDSLTIDVPDDNTPDFYTHNYTPLNNEIRVTNRSNDGVTVDFRYTFEYSVGAPGITVVSYENKFNRASGVKTTNPNTPVDYGFFTDATAARTAAGNLSNAIDAHKTETLILSSAARSETLRDGAVTDRATSGDNLGWGDIVMSGIRGSVFEPYAGAASHLGSESATSNTQQSQSMFFTFWGHPDVDSELIGQPFKEVGTITLAFTPAGNDIDFDGRAHDPDNNNAQFVDYPAP